MFVVKPLLENALEKFSGVDEDTQTQDITEPRGNRFASLEDEFNDLDKSANRFSGIENEFRSSIGEDISRERTTLDNEDEFMSWYEDIAAKTGLNPDPDALEQKYDYRGAFKAGLEPKINEEDNKYHWPSQFKDDDHPNRYVDGEDTKYIDLIKKTYPELEQEGLYEGFVKPAGKSLVKVPTAIAGSMVLLPGAGIMSLIELLPSIDPDPNKGLFRLGSLDRAMETYNQIMGVPISLLNTPEDVKAANNLMLVMEPIKMAGEGWGIIGEGIDKGLQELGLAPSYLEPLLATYGEAAAIFALPEVVKGIKDSTQFRMLNVRERGLIVQSLAEMKVKNPQMTEGQILREFNNPTWMAEALEARSITKQYAKIKQVAEDSAMATVNTVAKNKVNNPPKPKDPTQPVDIDPEFTFTSKKGNNYTYVNGKWYNKKGVEATNSFVIKAAERGKVKYKATDDATSEQLKKDIEEHYEKGIDEVTDKEIEEYVEKEVEIKVKKKKVARKKKVKETVERVSEEPAEEVVKPKVKKKAKTLGDKVKAEKKKKEPKSDLINREKALEQLGEDMVVDIETVLGKPIEKATKTELKNLMEVWEEKEAEIEIPETSFRQEDSKVTKNNLDNMRPYQHIDNVDSLIGRIEAEVNGWLDGIDVDINATRGLIEKLADESKTWAEGTDIPPSFFAEMNQAERINFAEHMDKLDKWAQSVKRKVKKDSGVQLNMMIPVDKLPGMVKEWMGKSKVFVGKYIQDIKKDGIITSAIYRNKELFDKTGFWLARDGKWRYEIGNHNTKYHIEHKLIREYNKDGIVETTVQDVLQLPKLFKAIPGIDKIKIIYDKEIDDLGFYDWNDNTIYIRHIEDKVTFFHELQHAINYKTNAFGGTNIDKESQDGDMEARIKLALILDNAGYEKTASDVITTTRHNVSHYKDHIYDLLREDPVALGKVREVYNSESQRPYTRYLKNPGEMEARLTERRMHINTKRMSKEYPWETLERMLYLEDIGGESVTGPSDAGTKLYSGPEAAIYDKIVGAIKTRIPKKAPDTFIKDDAKELIIRRRGGLGVATFDTKMFVNSIERRTNKLQREVMPFVIEGTDIPDVLNRPDLQGVLKRDRVKLQPIAEEIKDHFETGFKRVKANLKDMSVKQIRDYVTHLWDIPKNKQVEAINWFSTKDRFMEQRFIDTYAEGIEKGFKPKTLDITEIIKVHDAVGNRAIENVKFIKALMALEKEGAKLITRGEAPLDWPVANYPTLTRRIPLSRTQVKRKGEFIKESQVFIHPDLARPLKIIFGQRVSSDTHLVPSIARDPMRRAFGNIVDIDVLSAYEGLNSVMKKTMLSINLFHHTELFKVGVAEMGLAKTASVYFNPAKIYRALVKGDYEVYRKSKIARDGVKHNLQIGPSSDIPIERIQKALNGLAAKTQDKVMIGRITKFTAELNSVWDKALWDYLHDTLKLYAYESSVARLDPMMGPEMMRKSKIETAQRINDQFGGQNWDVVGLSPGEVQAMTWSLLSADWTASTIRQGLAPTGIGRIYKETKGLRAKGGARFWLRAGLYFGIGLNMLNMLFRDMDMDENPQYYQDKEEYDNLDKTMFWGNTIGNKSKLFVGRYDDGSERYMTWDKQWKDSFGLLYLPLEKKFQKLGGKAAPVPQAIVEIFTGHTLSGFKNDDLYKRKGLDFGRGILKKVGGSFLPLSLRKALKENSEFHATDLFTQSSKGLSRYRVVEGFKEAIIEGDEDLYNDVYIGALRNNLPAFTLFNASLSWVKAEAARETNKDIESIEEARAALSVSTNAFDKKRFGSRLVQLEREKADKEAGVKLAKIGLAMMRNYIDITTQDAPPAPRR